MHATGVAHMYEINLCHQDLCNGVLRIQQLLCCAVLCCAVLCCMHAVLCACCHQSCSCACTALPQQDHLDNDLLTTLLELMIITVIISDVVVLCTADGVRRSAQQSYRSCCHYHVCQCHCCCFCNIVSAIACTEMVSQISTAA